MVVEIAAGGRAKYEIDPDSGRLFVDRLLQTPMGYPAHYGSIPQTLAGDSDPMDALVYSREPLLPGVLIRVRPLALLRMVDAGEEDLKVIAVPTLDVDPGAAGIQALGDLGPLEGDRIALFFRQYKAIPAGADVRLGGFEDAAAARGALAASRERYLREHEAHE